MNTNAKRKNRTANNRGPRNKPTVDRNMVDGIYNNGRFMHTAASLVGCLVQVLTTNGSLFEGIFRTFSQQFEVVIELAHKLDRTHPKLPSKDTIIEKLIFKIADVVNITCYNTDMEYATKDSFATDTTISKFNGQIQEKELEPWEGASGEGDELPALDSENANGWDANEMFRTNEQQYGVQSTYEPTLAGYTTPLERKNTEEFKKQEAKASKIASEIENSPTYKKRNDLENGDEEERFSAVVRTDSNLRPDSNTQKYVPPAKRKNPLTGKLTRTALPPVQNSYGNVSTVKSHPPGHMQHSPHIPSSSHNAHNNPHTQSPPVQHSQPPSGIHAPSHYGPPQQPSSMNSVINSSPHQSSSPPQVALHPPPQPPKLAPSSESEPKVNGEKIDKDEKKPNKPNESTAVVEVKDLEPKVLPEVPPAPHIGNKIDRKNSNPKVARDEQIAELKKFSSDFKLTDESKDDKPEASEPKDKIESEVEKASSAMKKSTLNPNAKEFVLNPNAKSFTPRSPSTQTPTPPRPQTPSTVMAQPPSMSMMPPHHLFSGLAPHQYMMPAPVSGVLTPQFNPATTMQPASRIRKGAYTVPASVHQQRHEFSQVAAATGQPILAPPSLPTHHIPVTVQYPQGMVPNPGQPAMPYPQVQVYSVVGPRMVAPHQAIPMVPTSHSNTYPDNQHVHSQVFVSTHPPGPVPTPLPGPTPPHHAATPIQTIPAGPHSTPPTQQGPMPGQNQSGGGVHPNPSPVHQPPPHGAAPTQPTPPATVGAPQPLVYQQPHAAQLGQPPLQPSPHTPNSPQTIHPNPTPTLNHNPHLHHNPVSHASSSHGGPHITQTHPHHPGNPGPTAYPAAAAAAHQSLVLIHQQAPTSALSAHPQPVPTGHTFQTSMHGPGTPGPVPHIMPSSMQLPVLPNTSGAATMPSHPPIHYIPQHALNVQLQLHPNHPCSRMLMPNEQANAKPHTWFVRLKQDPKGKKKQHE